jgi:hypothetical protein
LLLASLLSSEVCGQHRGVCRGEIFEDSGVMLSQIEAADDAVQPALELIVGADELRIDFVVIHEDDSASLIVDLIGEQLSELPDLRELLEVRLDLPDLLRGKLVTVYHGIPPSKGLSPPEVAAPRGERLGLFLA